MDDTLDEYRLEDIALRHGIAAALFVPFTIARLGQDERSNEAILTVELRDISQLGERQGRLRLWWSAESMTTEPLGVQAHTITEWAALGIACAVMSRYAGLRIEEVADRGERFDYWVTDGLCDYGLEVSGTMTEDVEARHREKVRQLRANPASADGFVVVVGFATSRVVFSYHRFEEVQP